MATATKTSLEHIASFELCYFAIVSTHSTSTKLANNPGSKLVGVAFELRIHHRVLTFSTKHKTLNLVISRCCFTEDDKEMYQNLKRACRAIVFS